MKALAMTLTSSLMIATGAMAQSDLTEETQELDMEADERPEEAADWSNRLGAKYSLNSGAKRVSTLTALGSTEKLWTWGRLEAGASLSRAEDTSADEPQSYLVDVNEKLSVFVFRKAYVFESVDYKRDTQNLLDYRVLGLAGPGLNLWQSGTLNTVDVDLGAGVRYQQLSGETDETDAIYQGQIQGQVLVAKSVKFEQGVRYIGNFDDSEDYILESKTGVSIPVTASVASTNDFVYTQTGLPAEGAPEETIALSMGVEYVF